MAILSSLIVATIGTAPAIAQKAAAPYEPSVFATAPKGSSALDSVAVLHDSVFVGYGDGNLPDGSDGKSTQIVEYALDGSIRYIYTVKGHNDGLKVNPITHRIWALQNEDAAPGLVVINPETHAQREYKFGSTPHGGGYDDIVFLSCKAYVSASNPANNPTRVRPS